MNWRAVRAFHAFVELEPVLLPKLVMLVFCKVLVALIMAVLGCLGFVWGKQLYDRLIMGYAHVAAPEYSQQPTQRVFPQPTTINGPMLIPGGQMIWGRAPAGTQYAVPPAAYPVSAPTMATAAPVTARLMEAPPQGSVAAQLVASEQE